MPCSGRNPTSNCSPMTTELHRLIREHSASDNEYKRYIDSLKSSVLTAFYTPPAVTEALADVLNDYNVRPRRLLEPSAGHGAFVEAFLRKNADTDVMAFEKDLLTGKVLAHLYPDKKVRAEGFERIEKPFDGYFDAAVSNIPFGDVAVFDPTFSASESAGRRNAAKAIHNYFFLQRAGCRPRRRHRGVHHLARRDELPAQRSGAARNAPRGAPCLGDPPAEQPLYRLCRNRGRQRLDRLAKRIPTKRG